MRKPCLLKMHDFETQILLTAAGLWGWRSLCRAFSLPAPSGKAAFGGEQVLSKVLLRPKAALDSPGIRGLKWKMGRFDRARVLAENSAFKLWFGTTKCWWHRGSWAVAGRPHSSKKSLFLFPASIFMNFPLPPSRQQWPSFRVLGIYGIWGWGWNSGMDVVFRHFTAPWLWILCGCRVLGNSGSTSTVLMERWFINPVSSEAITPQ